VSNTTPSNRALKGVLWLYVLAYALSWAIWSPLVLLPEQSEGLGFLVILGAFGPLLAAAIAAWIEAPTGGGWAGCKEWLKSAFTWRLPIGWYLLGGLGLPLGTAALHAGLGALLGGQVRAPADPAWPWTALLFPVSVLVNAVLSSAGGEEPGWRGYALPRLARRMHPLAASVLMGALWGPWHGPLFFTTQWQGREQAWLFFLYCIPLSVIANWLTFKSRRGAAGQSALPAMLLHAGTNGYGALFVLEGAAIGSLGLGFTGIKTVVYWVMALVLIVATRGRLGYRAAGREDRAPTEGRS
jgi:membrane protease YdiL (CAAX protease family)